MTAGDVADQAEAVASALRAVLGDGLRGLYLYGSAVVGGLRSESDLDVFAVVARPIREPDRRRLVAVLTPISARTVRPPAWRPIDLVAMREADVRRWRYPPRMELQFGEWLRAGFDRGVLPPGPEPNPDLAVLVTMVRDASRPLVGPAADVLIVARVPGGDLVRAAVESIDTLLADLETDTRNVLLTLARMWSTVGAGLLLPKDQAASWAAERLPPDHAAVMERARAGYRAEVDDAWDGETLDRAERLATHLAREVRRAAVRESRSEGWPSGLRQRS